MNGLNKLGEWSGTNNYIANISAQFFLAKPLMTMSGVGSSCGAADPGKKEEKSSACGVGDPAKKEEKPSACGSACGVGDPAKKEEKPSACGSACGAGDPAKK